MIQAKGHILAAALILLTGCAATLPGQSHIQQLERPGLDALAAKLQMEVAQGPASPTLLLRLAQVEFRRGALESAERLVLQADSMEPFQGATQALLGGIYFEQGKRFRALNAYNEAIRLQPDLLTAYTALATIHRLLEEREQAKKVLQAVLARENKFFPALESLAKIQYEDRQYEAALNTLNQAFLIRPKNREIRMLEIKVLRRRANFSRAQVLIQEALLKEADPVPWLSELLAINLEREEWAQAAEVLARLKAEGPLPPWQKLAGIELLRRGKSVAEAEAALRELIQTHPDYAPALRYQARHLLFLDQPEAALRVLESAVILQKPGVEAFYWKAATHFQLGEILQGESSLARAMRIDPGYAPLRLLSISRHLAERRYSLAGAELARFTAEFPYSEEAILLYAEYHTLVGAYGDAEAILSSIAPETRNPKVLFAKTRLAYLRRQYQQVLRRTEDAQAYSVKPWRMMYLRGAALMRLGRFGEAESLLTPLLPRLDGKGGLHFLLGNIHYTQDRFKKAAEVYQEGLFRHPRHPLLIEGMGRVAMAQQNWIAAKRWLELGLDLDHPFPALLQQRLIIVYEKLGLKEALHTARAELLEIIDPLQAEARISLPENVLFGVPLGEAGVNGAKMVIPP